MSWVAAAVIGGAGLTAGASIYASGKQSDAARYGMDVQREMFEQGRHAQQPFVDAGTSMLPTLKSLLTPGPSQTDTLSQTPGFQFAQDWGMKGIKNAASSRGIGGNVMAEGGKFASGLAQNTFFPLLQAIQALVTTGSSGASSIMGGATAAGKGIAGSSMDMGNAQAGGIMGGANAIVGGANSMTNLMMLNKLTNGKLFGGTDMYGGGGTPAPMSP